MRRALAVFAALWLVAPAGAVASDVAPMYPFYARRIELGVESGVAWSGTRASRGELTDYAIPTRLHLSHAFSLDERCLRARNDHRCTTTPTSWAWLHLGASGATHRRGVHPGGTFEAHAWLRVAQDRAQTSYYVDLGPYVGFRGRASAAPTSIVGGRVALGVDIVRIGPIALGARAGAMLDVGLRNEETALQVLLGPTITIGASKRPRTGIE